MKIGIPAILWVTILSILSDTVSVCSSETGLVTVSDTMVPISS